MQHANRAFDFGKVLSSATESNSRFAEEWGALHESLNQSINQSFKLPSMPIPANLKDSWEAWLSAAAAHPEKIAVLQKHFAEEQQRLLSVFASPELSSAANSAAHAGLLSATDKRFNTPDWQSPAPFRYLAESYLTSYKLLMESIDSLDLAPEHKHRLHFFAKQYADAISPANFLFTNPQALKAAIDTKGESLRMGLANLQADIDKGHISLTDEAAFEVGKNIAVTPGAVVFENDIFQLLQYSPQTSEVHIRPLLIVPPCINKFYILDLRPDNSYIEYAVQQGFTVFVISWRNAGTEQSQLTWDDYLANGVVKAIDVSRQISNVHKINTLGFCVGGTMLAAAIAVLKRMGHDVIESVTFLTTFLDFSEVGDIGAYVDEAFVARCESEVGIERGGGIIHGAEISFAFSSLRANELIWNYVTNNYLQGKKPPPFDLLFWNSDGTNLPGPWYCYYLRNTYFENSLIVPDKLTMCDVPVDLSYVDMPAFVLAARGDHIVPWQAAYASTRHLGSEAKGLVEFVLGASGHIAGVVNPASKNKRSYWAQGQAGKHTHSQPAENWIEQATEHAGSWWPRWAEWLRKRSGVTIPAMPARVKLGNADFRVIEDAPGRYVKSNAKSNAKANASAKVNAKVNANA